MRVALAILATRTTSDDRYRRRIRLGNYAGVWVGSAGIGFLGTSSSLPWERRGEVTSLGEERERRQDKDFAHTHNDKPTGRPQKAR